MDITKIPAIMRTKGWHTGATFLDTWFNRAASIAPKYTTPPVNVSLSWVRTFDRAKEVFDRSIKERVWVNSAAQKEIQARLRANGVLGKCGVFGNLSQAIELVDTNYINFRVVDSGANLDGLTAALGNFAFHYAIEASVNMGTGAAAAVKTGKSLVEVTAVGIYLVDSFDFNDPPDEDQFLGYWDDGDNSVSMINLLSGDAVHNSDFRKWRGKMGGDFMVYSDIHVIKRSPPDTFTI